MPVARASNPEINVLLASSAADAQRWIDQHPDLIEVRWLMPLSDSSEFAALATRHVAVTDAARDDPAMPAVLDRLKPAVANGFLIPRPARLEWELG